MELAPLGDRIVVKRQKAKEKTAGGLYVPDAAQEKPQEGEVVAVGPGKWNQPGSMRLTPDVRVGDRVLFGKFSGTEFAALGDDVVVLREDDLLGILR